MPDRFVIVRVKIQEMDGELERVVIRPSDDYLDQLMTVPMRDVLKLEPILEELEAGE